MVGAETILESVVVDDTGAIIAGLPLRLPARHYTTSLVVGEVKDKASKDVLETALTAGRVQVVDPEPGFLERARSAARRWKLAGKLSEADISVAALALQLREGSGARVMVATDDYTLQDFVSRLGLPVIPIRYPGARGARRA